MNAIFVSSSGSLTEPAGGAGEIASSVVSSGEGGCYCPRASRYLNRKTHCRQLLKQDPLAGG